MLLHEHITGPVIRGFHRVYDALGHGFLESVYANALALRLTRDGLRVERERTIDVWYDGVKVGRFRTDMIVEDVVIVEIKAARFLDQADRSQMLNYLRSTELEVGLLLHFGPTPKFERFILTNTRKSLAVPR